MIFKTTKLHDQWIKLKDKNKFLYDMVCDIAEYSKTNFNKSVVVTDIFRTEQEQIKLYGYARPSVHMHWRGLDLRSWIYNESEIKQLLEYINYKYLYDEHRPHIKCAIHHKISGGAEHFHLQTHPKTKKRGT